MRLMGRDWLRVALYALAGMSALGLGWFALSPLLDYAVNSGPKLPGPLQGWLLIGIYVAGTFLPCLGLAAHLVLRFGPREEHLAYRQLWLMASGVSLLVAAVLVVPHMFPRWEQGAWTHLVKMSVAVALLVAWCLTWALDVVRRRKLAQGVAS